MITLLLNMDKESTDYFIKRFIEKKLIFKVIYENEIEKARLVSNEKQIENILLDYDGENDAWIELLQYIQKKQKNHQIKIVVRSNKTQFEMLQKLISIGARAFIPKEIPLEEVFEKTFEAFDLEKQVVEKRKHIRIIPDKKDRLTLTFSLPDCKERISGEIKNLSYSGLSFQPDNKCDIECMPGFVVEDAEIDINGITFTIDLLIKNCEEFISFEIVKSNDAFKYILSNFIYNYIRQ